MAMSRSEFNRINEQDRKIMELEARLWQLEKQLELLTLKRPPGRPKRAEQETNPRSN